MLFVIQLFLSVFIYINIRIDRKTDVGECKNVVGRNFNLHCAFHHVQRQLNCGRNQIFENSDKFHLNILCKNIRLYT